MAAIRELGDRCDPFDLGVLPFRAVLALAATMDDLDDHGACASEVSGRPRTRVVLADGLAELAEVDVLVHAPLELIRVVEIQCDRLIDDDFVHSESGLDLRVVDYEGDVELGERPFLAGAWAFLIGEADGLEGFTSEVVDRRFVFPGGTELALRFEGLVDSRGHELVGIEVRHGLYSFRSIWVVAS